MGRSAGEERPPRQCPTAWRTFQQLVKPTRGAWVYIFRYVSLFLKKWSRVPQSASPTYLLILSSTPAYQRTLCAHIKTGPQLERRRSCRSPTRASDCHGDKGRPAAAYLHKKTMGNTSRHIASCKSTSTASVPFPCKGTTSFCEGDVPVPAAARPAHAAGTPYAPRVCHKDAAGWLCLESTASTVASSDLLHLDIAD